MEAKLETKLVASIAHFALKVMYQERLKSGEISSLMGQAIGLVAYEVAKLIREAKKEK